MRRQVRQLKCYGILGPEVRVRPQPQTKAPAQKKEGATLVYGHPLQRLSRRHVPWYHLRRVAQHLGPFAQGEAHPSQLMVRECGEHPAYKDLIALYTRLAMLRRFKKGENSDTYDLSFTMHSKIEWAGALAAGPGRRVLGRLHSYIVFAFGCTIYSVRGHGILHVGGLAPCGLGMAYHSLSGAGCGSFRSQVVLFHLYAATL